MRKNVNKIEIFIMWCKIGFGGLFRRSYFVVFIVDEDM